MWTNDRQHMARFVVRDRRAEEPSLWSLSPQWWTLPIRRINDRFSADREQLQETASSVMSWAGRSGPNWEHQRRSRLWHSQLVLLIPTTATPLTGRRWWQGWVHVGRGSLHSLQTGAQLLKTSQPKQIWGSSYRKKPNRQTDATKTCFPNCLLHPL